MPPKENTNAKVQKQNVVAAGSNQKQVNKTPQIIRKEGGTQESRRSPKTQKATTNSSPTTTNPSSPLLLRSRMSSVVHGEGNNYDNYGGGGERVVRNETNEPENDNDLSSASNSFDSLCRTQAEELDDQNHIVASSVPPPLMPTYAQSRFLEASNKAARDFISSAKFGEDATDSTGQLNRTRANSNGEGDCCFSSPQENTKSERVTDLLMKSISNAESSLRRELATLFADRVKNTADHQQQSDGDPSDQLLSHVSLLFGTRQTFKEVLRHRRPHHQSCADMYAPQSGSTVATSYDGMLMAQLRGTQDGENNTEEDGNSAFEAIAIADPDFVLAQFENALPKRLFCFERSLSEKRTTEKRRRQASLHLSARRPTVAPSASFSSSSPRAPASASVAPALIRSRTNGDGGDGAAERPSKGRGGLIISKKQSSTSTDLVGECEASNPSTAVRTDSYGRKVSKTDETVDNNIKGHSAAPAYVQLLTLGDCLSRIRDALPPFPVVKSKRNANVFSSGDGYTSDVCVDRRKSGVAFAASSTPREECTEEEDHPQSQSSYPHPTLPFSKKITTSAPLGLSAEPLKKVLAPPEDVATSISERAAALLLLFSHRLVGLFDYTVANEAEAHRLAMMRSKHRRRNHSVSTNTQQRNSGDAKEEMESSIRRGSRGAALPAELVFFPPESDSLPGSCCEEEEEEEEDDVDNKNEVERCARSQTATTPSPIFASTFASENKELNDEVTADKNSNKICGDVGEEASSVSPTSSSYLSFAPTFVEEWLELVDSLCPELASPLGALSGVFSYVFTQVVTAQHRILTTRGDQMVMQRREAQVRKGQAEAQAIRFERDALKAEVEALRRELEVAKSERGRSNERDGEEKRMLKETEDCDEVKNTISGEKERASEGRGGLVGDAEEEEEEGSAPKLGNRFNHPDVFFSDKSKSLKGGQEQNHLALGACGANSARTTIGDPLKKEEEDSVVLDLLARQQHVIDELRRALDELKKQNEMDEGKAQPCEGVSMPRRPIIDVLRFDDKAAQTDNEEKKDEDEDAGKCPQCLRKREGGKAHGGRGAHGGQHHLRGEDDGSGYIFFDQAQHAQTHNNSSKSRGLEGGETCLESAPHVMTEGLPATVSNKNCSGSRLSPPTQQQQQQGRQGYSGCHSSLCTPSSCSCTTTRPAVNFTHINSPRDAEDGSQRTAAEGTNAIGQPSPCSPLHPEEVHNHALVNPMLQQIMAKQQRRYEESVAMLSSSSSVSVSACVGGPSVDSPLHFGTLRNGKGDETDSSKKTTKDPLLKESVELFDLLLSPHPTSTYRPPLGLLLTPKTSLEGIVKGVVAGVLGSAGVAVLERDELLCRTSSCSSSNNSSGSSSAEEGDYNNGKGNVGKKQSAKKSHQQRPSELIKAKETNSSEKGDAPTSTGFKDSYALHHHNPNPPPLRGHGRRTLNSGAGARVHSGGEGKVEEIKSKVTGDLNPSLGCCDVTRSRVGLGVDEEAFAQFMSGHQEISVGAVVPRPPRASPAREGVRSSPRHNKFNCDPTGPKNEQGQPSPETGRNPNDLLLSARNEGKRLGNEDSNSREEGAGNQSKTLILIKPRGILASKQQGGDLGLGGTIKRGERKANGVSNTSPNTSLVVVGGTIAKPNGLLFSTPQKGTNTSVSPLSHRQVQITNRKTGYGASDSESHSTVKTIDKDGPLSPSSSSSAYIAQQNNWVAFWEKEDARKAERKRQERLSIERRLLHATLQTKEGMKGETDKKNNLINHPKYLVASEKATRERVLEALRDFNDSTANAERAKTIEALLAASPRKFGNVTNDGTRTTTQSPRRETENSSRSSNSAFVDVGTSNAHQSDKSSSGAEGTCNKQSTSTTGTSPSINANMSPSLELPRIVGPSGGAIANRFSESTSSDRVHAVGLLKPRPPPSLPLPSAARHVSSDQPSFLPSLTGVLPPRLTESREKKQQQSGGNHPAPSVADVGVRSGDGTVSPRSMLDVQRIAIGDSEAVNTYLRYLDDVLDRLSSGTQ